MGDKLTVNELLILMKEVRSRVYDLKSIRQSCTVKEEVIYADQNATKKTTPEYDVRVIDAKITNLETWLFKAEASIKQSNAKTIVDIETDVDDLLAPLV